MTRRVRVGINGYGVIGKRVADAVKLQDDMELVGVADVVHDYRIRVAVERGYSVFASAPDRRPEMEAAGIPVVGTLDELIARAEIIVDCTPKRRRSPRAPAGLALVEGRQADRQDAQLRGSPLWEKDLPVRHTSASLGTVSAWAARSCLRRC